MKKYILVLVLVFCGVFISINYAAAWTESDDLEGNGAGYWNSYISQDYSHSGSHSIKFVLKSGVESVGIYDYPLGSELREGDELWVRVYIYAPLGFDWTCNPITKLLRTTVANSSGASWSYISILATNPGDYGCGTGKYGYMVTGAEALSGMNPPPICQNRNTADGGGYLTPGQWHSIELYIKVSATSGIIRGWLDGVLRNEYLYPTIPSGGYMPIDHTSDWNVHHLLGWWNGGPRQDQNIYFDDFIATNIRPANRDAAGNYMIGQTDGGSCSCTPWQNGSCSVSGCSLTQRQQTRTCTPSGCNTTSQCVADTSCTATRTGDLNSDNRVDVIDLGIFLSNWGSTSRPPADLNQDGKVDVVDFGILLSNWG